MNTSHGPIARYHQVEVALAERLRSGAYPSGTLPAERRLAQEFGVARVTIRHALRRLEDQGLVVRRQRRGTMSSTAAAAPRPMLREHMNQFLDRGRSDQRRVLYFGMDRASSLVAEALGLEPGASVLKVVRLRSREGSPLTYTESLVPGRLAHVLDRTALARRALIQALEDGGIRVGGAKQTIRAERCPQAIASLLAIETHEPVLVLERVVFDEADEPVQHLKGWYRADRFEIQLQMSRAEDSARVQVQPRWG